MLRGFLAVSKHTSSGKVEFYYATNGPCDPSVGLFLKQVREALAEDNIDQMSKKPRVSFMATCAGKFKGRFNKARKALHDCGDILGPSSVFE